MPGDLSSLTAVILAGGLGTRLQAVVADRPKVLADIGGRPFLAYLLDQLAAAGIRYAVLCTGYLGEQVQSAFGHSYAGLRLAYSQEPSPLGTAGALRLAMPLLESDPVLVMNGDSFCQADLPAFWAWHCAHVSAATLLVTEMPDTERYGRVQTGADDRVLHFDEKGSARGPGWISAGIYLLSRSVVETIPSGRAVSIERETFPAWIGRGLYAYRSQGRFMDIGTPETYTDAERFFHVRI